MTKAAEELHYTQSGISHIIKNLEKDLGFPLLIRSNTDFRLTSEGEALLPVFREIALGEEKLAKTLQESLKDYWGPEALSVSIKGVAPEEFGDYIHKKIEDEELILTSDYVK